MINSEKIKTLLSNVKFACMATVNADGSPHNSPLVFLYDRNFEYIYWGSHPDSQHSQNILRTGQAFFSAYDSNDGNTGLYIKVAEGKILEGEDLKIALEIHNRFRVEIGKGVIDLSYYTGGSLQKMWRGKVEKIWVNAYEKGNDGKLIKDYKIEISPADFP